VCVVVNAAIGFQAGANITTGSSNISIGDSAASFVQGGNSNNIHIGSIGSAGDSVTIRIGNGVQTSFFAAGVRGITTGNNDAIPVVIDSNGQLGTVSSSRWFKEDIEDMGAASHDLMRLRPVTFRYKQPFSNGSKPIQFGLIAEEVADVYPDLVAYSSNGQIETVKYQLLDSMLLNELQNEHRRIDEQAKTIRLLANRLAELEQALAGKAPLPTSPSQ
jgi:Chaperone of endosialidase